MLQKNLAFGKINFIICAVSVLIILIGFLLMTGGATTVESGFNPDIFSARRIKLAPVVCLIGFAGMIVGILYPSKKVEKENPENK